MLVSFALRAADVTVHDSVVTLATNGANNYTFTDGGSGQSVTVALAMTAYSPINPGATLQTLDGDTRVGGNFQNGFINGSGVNFSASLVAASSGVTAGTVKFRIAGLGIRPVDSGGTLLWTSSVAPVTATYSNGTEILQSLDATTMSLSSSNYSAQLRFPDAALFQLTDAGALAGQSLALNASFTAVSTATGDAQIVSWLTTYSGLYARIYTNDLAKTNGVSGTTWSNGQENQTLPAYRGVQEISYSSNWIYLRTTGLGQHIMGPWYNDATRTVAFVNLPANQKALYRFPRTDTLTNPPAAKTPTFGGVDVIGYFVDGVAMFDALDGFVWTGSTEGNGAGQWRRAAYPNEGITFDPSYTHQQNTGVYHNHADPLALRYLLGDHVDFNPVTKLYAESTNAPTRHSPIIGWVRDGLPMYGPYGYSVSNNASSGVRRMVSGYVLRDGANGTDDLTSAGRGSLPAWTLRNNGNTAASGPDVSGTYPLGRYLQDYAYLGDLVNPNTSTSYVLGADFDLNEFSARYCVTPEFPGGTWAYFLNIDSNGTPAAPWVVGQFFMGNPTGNKFTNITDTIVTNFSGGPNLATTGSAPKLASANVTLTWSSVDGGTYQVETTTNLANWTALRTNIASGGLLTTNIHTNGALFTANFYRFSRTALANYDPVTGTVTTNGGAAQGITSVVPNTGNRGVNNLALTITLNSGFTPAPPPNNVQPTGASLTGPLTIPAISYSRNTNTGIVTATFNLTNGIPTGPYTINTAFGPNTWSLTNGFTVQ
ncbi:MAG: YHYH protein [Verrucomicrobia bacterium]|nr:YHYH protein [Verrucomicrobiota bacterium]